MSRTYGIEIGMEFGLYASKTLKNRATDLCNTIIQELNDLKLNHQIALELDNEYGTILIKDIVDVVKAVKTVVDVIDVLKMWGIINHIDIETKTYKNGV